MPLPQKIRYLVGSFEEARTAQRKWVLQVVDLNMSDEVVV